MEDIVYDGKVIGKLDKIHHKKWVVASSILGKSSHRAIIAETSRSKAIEATVSLYKEVITLNRKGDV